MRRILRGVGRAVRARPGLFSGVACLVVVVSIAVPPVVLSLARRPVDYATFNPWLRLLPAYLVSPEVPLARKLEKLPDLALFWFSADSPFGGVDWGFAVDVTDLGRILLTGGLFGAYFALLAGAARGGPAARRGGVAGMLASAVGLSTGPCSVMGCGAPVLPVVGLALAGLSSGTLAALSSLSRAATASLLVGLALAVAWLGWRAGAPSATHPG